MGKDEKQIEMMKKFLEEKKLKNSSEKHTGRAPKSVGKTDSKGSTKGAKINNGGSTFDK